MNTRRIRIFAASAIMALASIMSCSKPEEQAVRPSSVSVSPSSAALTVGETVSLTATVLPSECEYSSIIWSSSNTKVATVRNGLVEAVSPGNAVISASADGVVGKAEVTVTEKYIAVNKVIVKDADGNTEGALHVSETVQLHAVIEPEDATERTIRWETTTEYASVDEKGLVTALGIGDCCIRAYAAGNVFGEYYCKIDPIAISSMKVVDPDGSEEGLAYVGSTLQLKAVIVPENASFQDLTWTSSDNDVASVDENGLVDLKKIGSVRITAIAGSSSIYKTEASYALTIKAINVTSVTVAPDAVSIMEGRTAQLNATIAPDNASIKRVIWASSDKTVATVDENGLVTAVKQGIAKIYASSMDNSSVYGVCVVTVEPDKTLVGITITPGEMSLQIGQTKELTVTFTPDYAANKNVSWSSSDPSVASVANGTVTALKEGVTTITATSEEGSFTASCKVTVSSGLPAGTKVFYGNPNSSRVYMNDELHSDKATRFTVSGQDFYSYYRYDGYLYKNGVRLFSVDDMLGSYGNSEMKVVGNHLYILAESPTNGDYDLFVLKVNLSTTREEKIHFLKEHANHIRQSGFDAHEDGTVYVLCSMEDKAKEVSSRLWTIRPDGDCEEKVLFRSTNSSLDSNGNNLLDAYETNVFSIEVDERGDVYYQVYAVTIERWTSTYHMYLYKNDKVIRENEKSHLGGHDTITVKDGHVYEAITTYDNGTITLMILKDGEKLCEHVSTETPSFYGIKADAKGSVYYTYNHKVYKDGKLLYSPDEPFITELDIME